MQRVACLTIDPVPGGKELRAALAAEPDLALLELPPGAADSSGTLRSPDLRAQLRSASPTALLIEGNRRKGVARALAAARRQGVPTLLRGELSAALERSGWARFRMRRALRRADACLALDLSMRNAFLAAGVPATRVFDVPPAVDVAGLQAEAETWRPRRQELRRAWQVPDGGFCVLLAPASGEHRPPLDLLDALELTRRERSDLRLLVLDSAQLGAALVDRARERRLPVTLAGRLEDGELPRAWAAADAFVVADAGPSVDMVSPLRAMASGLPGLIPDRAGCRVDLVEEGVTGFSYRSGDARALAACLTTLAGDPIRAAAMGEAARELVARRFSLQAAVRGLRDALRAVLAG